MTVISRSATLRARAQELRRQGAALVVSADTVEREANVELERELEESVEHPVVARLVEISGGDR